MASAGLRGELECSVCLSIYTDPVTLRCEHNFCRGCIDRVLNTQDKPGGYSCPECREKFEERPALHKNITLQNIVENVLSSQPDEETSGVFCTFCVDSPVPAVKVCLKCEAFLCNKHLRAHKKTPEHAICDPSTTLEDRKCSTHRKILEYYCTEDSACICVSCCLIGKHKGHHVESLNEASENKKRKLRNDLKEVMKQTMENGKSIQSLEERKRKAQEKADSETERVTVLFRDFRRRLEDLERKVLSDITRQAEQLSFWYDDVMRQLEIKKDALSRKMCHVEEVCNMTDPLTILQESDMGDLCDTEDRERHYEQLLDGGDLDVAGISHTLHTGLSDIISGLTGGIYIQPADILLNAKTASNMLQISDDRKTATKAKNQNYPQTPERYQDYPYVLSSQSFSSGRHYWDVVDGGSYEWRVGMCYSSIARRGEQSRIGMNKKSWGMIRRNKQCFVIHDSTEIRLPADISSDRVRIYLDYEAGQISLHDMSDPVRHLHTFTAIFTEPLHAALGLGSGYIKIYGGNREK